MVVTPSLSQIPVTVKGLGGGPVAKLARRSWIARRTGREIRELPR
jgi:hypothetical protein